MYRSALSPYIRSRVRVDAILTRDSLGGNNRDNNPNSSWIFLNELAGIGHLTFLEFYLIRVHHLELLLNSANTCKLI